MVVLRSCGRRYPSTGLGGAMTPGSGTRCRMAMLPSDRLKLRTLAGSVWDGAVGASGFGTGMGIGVK